MEVYKKLDKGSMMYQICSSDEPVDAMNCLAKMADFLTGWLRNKSPGEEVELSAGAAEGLGWILGIIRDGMEEVIESIDDGRLMKIETIFGKRPFGEEGQKEECA